MPLSLSLPLPFPFAFPFAFEFAFPFPFPLESVVPGGLVSLPGASESSSDNGILADVGAMVGIPRNVLNRLCTLTMSGIVSEGEILPVGLGGLARLDDVPNEYQLMNDQKIKRDTETSFARLTR